MTWLEMYIHISGFLCSLLETDHRRRKIQLLPARVHIFPVILQFLCLRILQSVQGARETWKICGYMLAIFGELWLYCWFGDKLMSEGENLTLAIYDAVTSLHECSTSIKRSLLLLMLRSQRPLCITAAGFFPLSRESFVSILNISYSFFTILRNFKGE
ncbi:odorant receptor Or2-like [Schistocerca gregaria]|uniref:odorant receptor Or2-like n=1 Tax=Schistocerca gregaria TaxID=7010 RepID=UPI00211EBEA3|nr:odorant receptor Or2-like [Schistocerca gregaria]